MKRQPSLLRRLICRWWQLVLLTLVVSAPLTYLIFLFVEPTYQAVSLLRVEPSAPNVFAAPRSTENSGAAGPYLHTHIQLIKSDQVLGAAVASPTVSILPTIKNSLDAKTELRKNLIVSRVEDTFLIRVALESKDPVEAATIVNAVVESYRLQNERHALSTYKRLRESLEREDENLQKKIEAVHLQLKALVDGGRVGVPAAKPSVNQTDTLQSAILNHELASLQNRKDSVTNNLAQLAFEANQEAFRIMLVDPATTPAVPFNNNRLVLMAAAPVDVFCLIFAWFLLLEIIAGRSARAKELSSARLRAEAGDLLETEYGGFQR
jgi:uncharacterized protein involved in exopolysaccharide biosynthesis